MRKLFFLIATMLLSTAVVGSFEDVQRNLVKHGVDETELNRLSASHISKWNTFSIMQKNTVIKGTIILMDMETSEKEAVFQKHVIAAMECMDTMRHGMSMSSPGAKVQLGAMECSAKTYQQFCTICKD